MTGPTVVVPETRAAVRAALRDLGLRPKKARGQNFLVDGGVAARIVEAAGPGPDDVVFEVGPGLGILTVRLAAAAAQVVAVEIEARLASRLRDAFASQAGVRIVESDALDGRGGLSPALAAALDDVPASRPLRVVANLPYSVATPLVQALLDRERPPDDLHVMVQREVADRLAAEQGSPAYGPLSVIVGVQATVRRILTVGGRSFHPAPAVASAVVRIVPLGDGRPDGEERRRITALVFASFSKRRKTLGNALAASGITADDLRTAGVDPRRRAESLSPREFRDLAASLPSLAPDPPTADTGTNTP